MKYSRFTVVGRIYAQAQELHNNYYNQLIFSLQNFCIISHTSIQMYSTIFIVHDSFELLGQSQIAKTKTLLPSNIILSIRDYGANIATRSARSTHLVRLICLHEGWLAPLLHQGARESGEAEVVFHDTDYLPQEPPQGSEVVLLPRQKVLEDATQELHDVMMM